VKSLILAAGIGLALSLAAHADPIKLATEGAYPPFNYVDDEGHVGGFDVEVGNELCRRAGLQCTWMVNDWDNIIQNMVSGDYDAIVADMTITDEHKQTIDFTDPYFPADPSTYLALASRKLDFKSFAGLKVGVQTGTAQASWAEQHLKPASTLVPYDTNDAAVAGLKDGNVDLVLADTAYLGNQAQDSAGTLVTGGPQLMIGVGAGIGVRKDEADLKTKLNTALAEIKADGWLDGEIRKDFPELGPGPFFGN
jgi:polar amino acid transport system substrate-binding protein